MPTISTITATQAKPPQIATTPKLAQGPFAGTSSKSNTINQFFTISSQALDYITQQNQTTIYDAAKSTGANDQPNVVVKIDTIFQTLIDLSFPYPLLPKTGPLVKGSSSTNPTSTSTTANTAYESVY
ncbi:MAG: hypothetical protein LQ337_003400 [Flavoplaca oasis]|nr:MAG: hypothetical protein LQ337_003400 [Flavoplaca oasis]